MELTCETCLTSFKVQRYLSQHRCPITICGAGESPDMIVRPNDHVKMLLNSHLKKRNSTRQLLLMSHNTCSALPGLAPLFFPSKHTPPVLHQLGCAENSYHLLRAAAQEGPVRLYKTLKIELDQKILRISNNLIPTNKTKLNHMKLKVVEKQDHVIIYYIGRDLQVSGFYY